MILLRYIGPHSLESSGDHVVVGVSRVLKDMLELGLRVRADGEVGLDYSIHLFSVCKKERNIEH